MHELFQITFHIILLVSVKRVELNTVKLEETETFYSLFENNTFKIYLYRKKLLLLLAIVFS